MTGRTLMECPAERSRFFLPLCHECSRVDPADPFLRCRPASQEYVGDILGSYVLMVAILVLTVAGLWYKPYRSKPITTDIVLEADPTPYVVGRTNPATQWGKYKTGQVQ